jgi:hypothetical protein
MPKDIRSWGHNVDFIKLICLLSAGGGVSQHTRLWRWMVYSRATTSWMAERWWPVFFLASDLPEVEGLSFGILEVVRKVWREADSTTV